MLIFLEFYQNEVTLLSNTGLLIIVHNSQLKHLGRDM